MEQLIWETAEELDQKLARRVRNIRKRRSISQEKLAQMSGVSYGSIKRFEASGQISLISLTKIAMALEIADELRNIFTQVPYKDIQEVINETISGKYDLFGNVSLCDPHLDCRRAKKMPYIRKTNIYSVTQCNSLIIITRCQQFVCCIGIRHCIERLIFRSATSPCFTIPPFRLKLLNMGTVTQHDITQI